MHVLQLAVQLVSLLFELEIRLNQLVVFRKDSRVFNLHIHEVILQFGKLAAFISFLILKLSDLLLKAI